ncbi:hypothetical protein ACT3UD_16990 [Glutamicibacter sp. 287]|uniref:hypothetical protein n=1 Tax=unclassified Glutamicibacter TaxID=2627139 RepID=UPI004033DEED
MTVNSIVRVHPVRSGKVSETFHIQHQPYPKGDRAKQAVKVVSKWAARQDLGANVVVEAGSLTEKGEEGFGRINLNGVTIAQFSVLEELPAPVPLASLLDGGLR